MSVAMDRALMALSLDEEDEEPFTMPDRPGFTSIEENRLSIMGRSLNPECQRMSGLIITMPRKWQKEGKVRGIALSRERFQFIFNSEHDLLDVLEKGVQTYNEWAMVLERWVEYPPEDYLQFIPLWVRISYIPEEYYTTEALTTLGDMIGRVIVVAFDPLKPVTQDYIRVQVLFNVANPLKMSRVINRKGGKTATIHFDYEQLQKRCFTCKRLNHEKSICPIEIRKRQEESQARRNRAKVALQKAPAATLNLEDPLYGVLEESQVGLDQLSGRPRIAKEVMDEMRRYMLADTGEDRAIKVDKLRSTVKEAEADPRAQRSVLRLEAAPMVTSDLNKGKGLVFDYSEKSQKKVSFDLNVNPNKLMAGAFKAFKPQVTLSEPVLELGFFDDSSEASVHNPFFDSSTVFRVGSPEPRSSGTIKKSSYVRRRPPKGLRNKLSSGLMVQQFDDGEDRREGKQEMSSRKRKKVVQEMGGRSNNKAQCLKAIPSEGSPNAQ
ncbi:uncharacterized protein LOC125595907 [Brassica napus]|uniref:uncharacterized protein LOC125578228 n=1 Tax=Brassica napus TaxID=3708 RepID=UPI002078B17C|nr:uncharacterized protein LOC125578228 [Brassica napus]XP_048627244.1 uncharacterized protein LOC125595907 [Brassica napus]